MKQMAELTTSENNSPVLVWVFAFEYAGIAKVGGLGEVSANQCRSLSSDPSLNLEVFLPSHNRHILLKDKWDFKPVKDIDGNNLVLKGHFDPEYFGLPSSDIIHHTTFSKYQSFTDLGYFEIELWNANVQGVSVNLLVGKNQIASRVLNDQEVYGQETLNSKLGLFSLAMKEYMRYCIYKDQKLIPDIIHIHDHHPVAALMCCRQELNLIGKDVRSIITMHLLTWPRRELNFFWKAGVNNEPMKIILGKNIEEKRMREVYQLAQTFPEEIPTLERIGCIISDRVIAVSENFLRSDIIPNCGGSLIQEKSNFTWNGCDWDYNINRRKMWKMHKKWYEENDLDKLQPWDLRKVFLTKILGNLPKGEPKLISSEMKQIIAEEFKEYPYKPDGTVYSFTNDGPLILMTGRVSPQKGIETIIEAMPGIVESIPNIKFIFLMVPTPYTVFELRKYMEFARKYPNNVRFLFGIAGSIFLLAHLAADVYTCPSHWEPFGIVALEAMASKIPVVATYVGGLMESILHLEDHPENGTGLLCPSQDPEALRYAIVSLTTAMQITEESHKQSDLSRKEFEKKLSKIVHPKLRQQIEKNPYFGDQIRENAYNRVQTTFRWEIVSQKLKEIYLEVSKLDI